MKTLILLKFFNVFGLAYTLDMKAYHCSSQNISVIKTVDMTRVGVCSDFSEWYPTKKSVNVQIISYPEMEKIVVHTCKLIKTVEITYCGDFNDIR